MHPSTQRGMLREIAERGCQRCRRQATFANFLTLLRPRLRELELRLSLHAAQPDGGSPVMDAETARIVADAHRFLGELAAYLDRPAHPLAGTPVCPGPRKPSVGVKQP